MERLRRFLKNGANLPCADMALLAAIKRSREYGAIRTQLANLKPLDAWQEYGIHHFLFGLRPEGEGAPSRFALFSMAAGETVPMSAILITPGDNAMGVYIRNLHPVNYPLGVTPPTTIPN